ncbi:MAG: fumarylacetoacetate hydrolase family protein, partial [Solirubrobacteraceae bacterium]
MRFANLDGRLTLVHGAPGGPLDGATGTDVHAASDGAIPADPALALAVWDEVVTWSRAPGEAAPVTIAHERLRAPSPRPAQIFGIGVNYADHGAEAAMEIPEVPL